MSLELIDYKFFLDHDLSPLIVFNANSKILYLNNSAELLLGSVDKKEIFDIALSYAPKSFGSKTTSVEFAFNQYLFHSITVSYQNENEIGIMFYHKQIIRKKLTKGLDRFRPTDINLLINASIFQFQTNSNTKVSLLTDIELPQVKLLQNDFSKILRQVFNSFTNTPKLDISLRLKAGEYTIIDEKKYRTLELKMTALNRNQSYDKQINEFANSIYINTILNSKSAILIIPFITD